MQCNQSLLSLYQDTMQLKGMGGNIPRQHIFNISPDTGLCPVIKLVLIIFGGRSSTHDLWTYGDKHLFSHVGDNIKSEGMDTTNQLE